jgi:hypothetical protein
VTEPQPDPIAAAASILERHGIEAGFLVPTVTALGKGIIDATWPLREYLAEKGYHDYRSQPQGESGRRVLDLTVLEPETAHETKVSLYRPKTKEGDPRIWIYGLPAFASANDVLALIVADGSLKMVNCTRSSLEEHFSRPDSPLSSLAATLDIYADTARELLAKLREISAKGFVPSLRSGDTGIGYTLETHLGIVANSNRAPDYKGIELKSGRMGHRKRTGAGRHVTLFSKVPNWGVSAYTARSALETFGYRDESTGRLQLFCSIDARQRNSLGFVLQPRPEVDQLVNLNNSRLQKDEDVFLWVASEVRRSFAEKHHETFWIGARNQRIGDIEHFHYIEARHTRKPSLSTFDRLLETGGICVDLTMSEKGKAAVRDHGYLFRIYGSRFDELFPEAGVYTLA